MMSFNDHGSYLVLESQIYYGDYTLSVRHNDKVNHHTITRSKKSDAYFIEEQTTFKSIVDLLDFYQQQADEKFVRLVKPCVLPSNINWEIDHGQITLMKQVGEDQISETWEGLHNGGTLVTVKVYNLQTKHVHMTAHDFLQVADLMKKLHHPNIIQLYAVCMKREPFYIITEFIKHNSLWYYLRVDGRSPRLSQLIDMASQVAAGMAYLEELNIIHRKLTARNILVSENLICKIGSFEMAGAIDVDILNDHKELIKWTAPEAAIYNRFTIKSDIWSFGIFLYEIITYGCYPYADMTNDQALKQVQQGYRMPQPMGCPDKLYNIMLCCWREDPDNRHTFETLQWQLEEFFIN